jgi:hypothetical protein
MRRGSVRLRGWYAVSVTAVFEPEGGGGKATRVLDPGWFLSRRRRDASECVRCGAVVLAPVALAPAAPESGQAFPRYGEADSG